NRHGGLDRSVIRDQAGETVHELFVDTGRKGNSQIYQKAVEMADSLREGDEFVFIGQWAPVKVMFGDLIHKLDRKAKEKGVYGTILMSPEGDLHPSRRVSRKWQQIITKKYEAIP